MARPGWYNDNANRTFPFLTGSTGRHVPSAATSILMDQLPDEVIVDAGFIVGVMSEFDSASNLVYLNAIRRSSDTFYFDFQSDATELYGVTLTFSRTIDDVDYLTEFSEASNSVDASCSESDGCCFELFSGYLTTFNVARLGDFLGDGDSLTRIGALGSAVVEPTIIQNMSNSFILTTGLSNANRTRATEPTDCTEYEWSFDESTSHITYDPCLKGHIKIEEGYNCVIAQNSTDNSITIGASVGRGKGEPCDEVKLFSSEAPPTGGLLLSGGPKCSETLRSINGKCGSLLSLESGAGIRITENPAENLITIDVDMSDLAICYGSEVSDISEDCGSYSD